MTFLALAGKCDGRTAERIGHGTVRFAGKFRGRIGANKSPKRERAEAQRLYRQEIAPRHGIGEASAVSAARIHRPVIFHARGRFSPRTQIRAGSTATGKTGVAPRREPAAMSSVQPAAFLPSPWLLSVDIGPAVAAVADVPAALSAAFCRPPLPGHWSPTRSFPAIRNEYQRLANFVFRRGALQANSMPRLDPRGRLGPCVLHDAGRQAQALLLRHAIIHQPQRLRRDRRNVASRTTHRVHRRVENIEQRKAKVPPYHDVQPAAAFVARDPWS